MRGDKKITGGRLVISSELTVSVKAGLLAR